MSVNYIDKSTGDLIRVAGQGKAEYGASTVRKGTVTVAVDPQQYTTVPVTFATPMPDADYLVDVSFPTQQPISYYVVNNRTKNGFQLFIKNEGGGSADASVTYTAFKLYTDTEYNNLLNNAVLTSDVTDSVTNGDMNPVTSNAVYDTLFTNDVEKTFFTPASSSGNAVAADCWYIRKGNVVTVSIGIASISASAPGEIVFTLPVGLRPCGNRVIFMGCNNNYGAECNIQIKQNGDISVVCNTGCFGTITYVVN